MCSRKCFSIFSCGCNRYKSIHLIGDKDTIFSVSQNHNVSKKNKPVLFRTGLFYIILILLGISPFK